MSPSHELARSLLEKARGDRHACLKLMDDSETPTWLVGFHAQQAVEKAIKAVLALSSIEYPRTHNLTILVELLGKHGLPLPSDADEIEKLTPFGAALRYDDEASSEDVPLDRAWAAACADRIVRSAEAQ